MIPVLNLVKPDMKTLLKQVAEMGVFYVPTQLSAKQTQRIFDSAHRLFDVEQEIKNKISLNDNGFIRGYVGFGKESGSEAFEAKEAFSFGFEWKQLRQNSLQGPNQWPWDEYHSDRIILQDFYTRTFQTSLEIIKILSLAVQQNTSWYDACKKGDTISLMRVFKYPAEEGLLGSSPHSDWGFLTMIMAQEKEPGLEFAASRSSNEWIPVPCRPLNGKEPSYYVVNTGDYMAGLTKKVHSPLHRVMTTPSPRMSLVYFGYPEFKASLPPLRDTEHSLYMNQGSFESTIEPKSFGDFITTKWASVQRP